jgi:hypothetical protein
MILKRFIGATRFLYLAPTVGTTSIARQFIRLILARKGQLLLPNFVDYCYLACYTIGEFSI